MQVTPVYEREVLQTSELKTSSFKIAENDANLLAEVISSTCAPDDYISLYQAIFAKAAFYDDVRSNSSFGN